MISSLPGSALRNAYSKDTNLVFYLSVYLLAHSLNWQIYPTKKETHHSDFPIKISFKYENVNCHKIFISDKILLKLKCDVDEYQFLHRVGTKHINAKGKGVFEALIQRYCLHETPSMFYISIV